MRTYLVCYNILESPNMRNKNKIFEQYLKSYSAVKLFHFIWLIKTYEPVSRIREDLISLDGINNIIIVMDVTNCDWSSHNISESVTNWMKGKIK